MAHVLLDGYQLAAVQLSWSSGVPWKLVGDVFKGIRPFVLPLYLAVGFRQGLSKTFDGRIVSQLLRPAEKRTAHKWGPLRWDVY